VTPGDDWYSVMTPSVIRMTSTANVAQLTKAAPAARWQLWQWQWQAYSGLSSSRNLTKPQKQRPLYALAMAVGQASLGFGPYWLSPGVPSRQ